MRLQRLLLVVVCATACSKSEGGSGGPPRPAAGKERGDCIAPKVAGEAGTCDPGLWCLSNLCVRPPPADCQVIADQLASFDLGNYAELEDRQPVVDRYKAACKKAHVSKEQGACMAAAGTKEAAILCAPLMFPEMPSTQGAVPTTPGTECARIVEIMQGYMQRSIGTSQDPQVARMLVAISTAMGESCEQDGWPADFKQCILAAGDSTDAMNQCNSQLPPDLQQKLTERMMKVMSTQTPSGSAPSQPPF